ncbi:MAG: DUF814 domain-containing protein [Nanoarchaeota archaeon]|nr:DUF814 domain-containing protein [Nanoarchaeota archaeon]
MKISITLSKSVEENAGVYFDKAKKSKKKIEGAKEALENSRLKLKKIEENLLKEQMHKEEIKKEIEQKRQRKVEWFEKFRWFRSSGGFLIIAGRDATTNEIVMKKHTDKDDLVFHTNMAGSPFAVIKAENRKIDEDTIRETAEFVASYSRAWKLGMTSMDVFSVNPEQVTKEAPSGEYITKGSFMIYGKKNEVNANINIFIGVMDDGKIMAGPESAVKAHCKEFVQIVEGREKPASVAKKIIKKLGGDLDEIIRSLPGGDCSIK